MPTNLLPSTGVKQSEQVSATELTGQELLVAIRPQASDPTKFENVNVPVGKLGGAPYDGLPSGPIALPTDGPQEVTVPAGIKLIAVWWNQLQSTGKFRKVALLKACYALSGTTLTLNDHIEGLTAGDTIDLSYSL